MSLSLKFFFFCIIIFYFIYNIFLGERKKYMIGTFFTYWHIFCKKVDPPPFPSYHFNMGPLIKNFQKQKFLELITSGMNEPRALASLGPETASYKSALTYLMLKDPDFKEAYLQAVKDRADVFFEKIVDSVDEEYGPKEVPSAKLRFEKLKHICAIDNPDKYAEKSKHSLDINLNIFQEMKDLPAAEARKILGAVNPFAMEAEFVIVKSEIMEDEELEDAL